MKKIFTLAILSVLALNASADGKYWDFSKWSPTTEAQVKGATSDWTNDEKGDGSSNVVPDNACVWNLKSSIADACDENGNLMAGGSVIAELEGLKWTGIGAKKVAIAFDYNVTTDANKWGPYKGKSYLWLNGKTTAVHFTIPAVEPGTEIKMGIESHKPSDARGVDLLVGGTKLDKEPTAYPTFYAEYTWTVPGEPGGEPVDVDVQPNNGCHIYFIQVGDGGGAVVEEAKKVAFVGTDDDFSLSMLDASVVAATTVATIPTLAELQENYDALVVGTTATEEQLKAVKDLIAFFPVVNTNPALYAAIGQGSAADVAGGELTVVDTENTIFEGLDEVFGTTSISALTLGDYFAQDKVLAKVGDAVAMHVHNAGRNAYYFVPVDQETETLYQLLSNTIVAASKTKRAVAAVGTPTITLTQKDGLTTVAIAATNSDAIYYTTDGTEPTVASTKYAEPFDLTTAATVKAFATGDGYTNSEVASQEVTIATQIAAPVFSVNRESKKTTVSFDVAEGVKVYYNFNGSNKVEESAEYKEPIVVTEPLTMTAFSTAEGQLNSEKAQMFIGVDGIDATNIRWDVVAHFNANTENWSGKGQQTDDSGAIINANYFFTWGKNAGSYWDETSAETIKASDGVTDSTIYTKTLEPSVYEADGWILKSIGQVMTWENLNIGWKIGDTSMRNPDTAEDVIGVNNEEGITEKALTFGKQPSGGPFNASLQTATKIAGPFDVILYAGNGNEGQIPTMQIEVSADGENWTKVGDVAFSLIKRNWKKTKLSYEGTDEVYVRLLHTAAKSGAQIYDIYVMNNGEKSKAYSEETAGVSTVKNVVARQAAVYSINGTRLSGMKKGLNIVVDENGKAKKVMVK
jgi:hypothetical protein